MGIGILGVGDIPPVLPFQESIGDSRNEVERKNECPEEADGEAEENGCRPEAEESAGPVDGQRYCDNEKDAAPGETERGKSPNQGIDDDAGQKPEVNAQASAANGKRKSFKVKAALRNLMTEGRE